jgi:hypothetical protein
MESTLLANKSWLKWQLVTNDGTFEFLFFTFVGCGGLFPSDVQ